MSKVPILLCSSDRNVQGTDVCAARTGMSKVPMFVFLGQECSAYRCFCSSEEGVGYWRNAGGVGLYLGGVMLNDAMNELNRLRLRISQSKDYL